MIGLPLKALQNQTSRDRLCFSRRLETRRKLELEIESNSFRNFILKKVTAYAYLERYNQIEFNLNVDKNLVKCRIIRFNSYGGKGQQVIKKEIISQVGRIRRGIIGSRIRKWLTSWSKARIIANAT